ncbi:RNA 2',3'-cyclic phosphodiesterase [Thermoactinomyces mirandus]|uniref:RNA 2',3'-cyclic phosphodiesterase n=1 Tax=Thermoactinomyces mirandus TaxID=2756294 RepID=A0A7W1XS40_9BACL|nr:RNA 2',3'-cyclic phosphodiesterase [Thermoactinomyces mirandus]MBA4602263.1 RNA 2',3'-cyclic phosphodiesterase [Thermoactinomyces mirandus]
MEETSRLFIALVLPGEVKRHLAKGCSMLKEKWKFSRWVHPDDYHITLYFLGDVSEKKKGQIVDTLHTCSAKSGSFSLNLAGLGTFGQKRQPRVLWAGVSGDLASLHTLQGRVTEAVRSLGFLPEKRAYCPHITLARKCQSRDFLLSPEANDFFREIRWKADEIALYETKPGHRPMYETVQKLKISL